MNIECSTDEIAAHFRKRAEDKGFLVRVAFVIPILDERDRMKQRITELETERDGWQQKWFADHGECKTLRKKVEFLKPFQEAYDKICGEDLVLEQQERAQIAEARIAELEKQIEERRRE